MNRRHSKEYAKNIRALMLPVLPRIFLNGAPESKAFPYGVVEIRALTDRRDRITVDLWHKKGNEIALMDLADSIEHVLDGETICNEYHSSAIFSDNNMQWIRDEDENIVRINLTFTATYQS